MACCGDKFGPESLENQKFEDISFKIENETIKYGVDPTLGGQYQRDINVKRQQDKEEEDKLNKAKEALRDQIKRKDDRIQELLVKIGEIDKKIAAMEQILSIDVSEKEYVVALGEQMKNNLPQNN